MELYERKDEAWRELQLKKEMLMVETTTTRELQRAIDSDDVDS